MQANDERTRKRSIKRPWRLSMRRVRKKLS